MKPQNLIHILIGIACFGLLPKVQAVVPTPDGCYPNYTTAEGCNALRFLGAGAGNTGVGWDSLFSVGAGNFNTGVGAGTLVLNTAGFNTAVGALALFSNTTGDDNTAIGYQALFSDTTGVANVANGYHALYSNTSGLNNVAIGDDAGFNQTDGGGNVYLGAFMDGTAGESNTTYIRNVYDSAASARAVYVNLNGKIGTLSSSRRYKDEIKAMDKASEALLCLKPVTFRYKKEVDPSRLLSFGLIAEEVAKIDPDLVTLDREGKPETVRYEAVNAMLLNEFLKEHHTVQELKSNAAKQEATIAQQQTQIEALTAGLQKVSAQLEAGKPATQVVNNP